MAMSCCIKQIRLNSRNSNPTHGSIGSSGQVIKCLQPGLLIKYRAKNSSLGCPTGYLARRSRGRLNVASPPCSFQQEAAGTLSKEGGEEQKIEEVPVKFIGIGSRGASALQKLIGSTLESKVLNNGQADTVTSESNVELWYVDDVNAKPPESVSRYAKPILIDGETSSTRPLTSENLSSLVGRSASDAGGKGNIGSGDGGVVFLLASCYAVPGGPALLTQLTAALRSAGHFTVVALAAPFGFEGTVKVAQARGLMETLQQQAHLVVVMEQDVLLQVFGESQLTVAEATDIADTALEHTALSVLQAIRAREILKSSRGALMWHGSELRHFKRLISPPLQQLLTGPGTAVLGRGVASLPMTVNVKNDFQNYIMQLMQLASEAVLSAAESPFLDGRLESASAILCCITMRWSEDVLTSGNTRVDRSGSNGKTTADEHRMLRMTAQAAAGALRTLAGRACEEFVVCISPTPLKFGLDKPTDNAERDNVMRMEASLLVLGPPSVGAKHEHQGTQRTRSIVPNGFTTPVDKTSKQNKLPTQSWGMLSAIAGGGAAAARSPPSKGNTSQQQQSTPVVKKPPVVVKPDSLAEKKETSNYSKKMGRNSESVGDYLAASLSAQSLDLPPAAAKWRQAQRADFTKEKRKLIVWEVDEIQPWEEEDGEEDKTDGFLGGFNFMGKRQSPKKKVDLKRRVAVVLERDREDSHWDHGED